MKAVILAGGFGSRLSEQTTQIPKPMVEIGGKPILIHIMESYSRYGINDFVICAGYKANYIKQYFVNYNLNLYDVSVKTATNEINFFNGNAPDWNITVIDTGLNTMTGGRLKRIKKYVENEPFFHMTYGDGVCDLDISELTKFHVTHEKSATVTSVLPVGRFGALKTETSACVTAFEEKPAGDGGRINGGYFVLSPSVLDTIQNDQTVWEQEPLVELAAKRELYAFNHDGFWHPMDTLRDKNYLEELWETGAAPWKVW